jgi:hypothetical protein
MNYRIADTCSNCKYVRVTHSTYFDLEAIPKLKCANRKVPADKKDVKDHCVCDFHKNINEEK